jgi:hypothetical protein
MEKQLKRRLDAIETCRYGSPRVAAMERRERTMSEGELDHIIHCYEDNCLDELPPLLDPRTLTDEECEASLALGHARCKPPEERATAVLRETESEAKNAGSCRKDAVGEANLG